MRWKQPVRMSTWVPIVLSMLISDVEAVVAGDIHRDAGALLAMTLIYAVAVSVAEFKVRRMLVAMRLWLAEQGFTMLNLAYYSQKNSDVIRESRENSAMGALALVVALSAAPFVEALPGLLSLIVGCFTMALVGCMDTWFAYCKLRKGTREFIARP